MQESAGAAGRVQSALHALLRRADRRTLGWVLCVALALVAFRDLLRLESETPLPEEIELAFFVPGETITPAILALSAWLLARRHRRLAALPAPSGGRVAAWLALAAGLGIRAWAQSTQAPDLQVVALIACGAGAALWWKGAAALRVVALPLGLLVFALPLPAPALNELIYPLQLATTQMSGALLYLLGVPHFVAGEQILRTEATFSVIESCSGLRSIETLSIVALLMVELFQRRGLHALVLVAAAPPTAFLLNALRALLLILNPHSDLAAVHTLQGIAILLGGLLCLYLIDGLLEWLRGDPAPCEAEPAAGTSGGRSAGPVLCALALAAAIPVALPIGPDPAPRTFDLGKRIDARLDAVSAQAIVSDRIFLGSAGFGERAARRVRLPDDSEAEIFVGIGRRAERRRSALSPKVALPGSGWAFERELPFAFELDGRRVTLRVMRSASRRQLIASWTENAASWPREALRTALALDRSPLRRPGEMVAVRIGVVLRGPLEVALPKGQADLEVLYGLLRPLLDEFGSQAE